MLNYLHSKCHSNSLISRDTNSTDLSALHMFSLAPSVWVNVACDNHSFDSVPFLSLHMSGRCSCLSVMQLNTFPVFFFFCNLMHYFPEEENFLLYMSEDTCFIQIKYIFLNDVAMWIIIITLNGATFWTLRIHSMCFSLLRKTVQVETVLVAQNWLTPGAFLSLKHIRGWLRSWSELQVIHI